MGGGALRLQKTHTILSVPLSVCLLFADGDVSSQWLLIPRPCSAIMDSNPLKL